MILTSIETKALCSVLRKAEAQGTEALIDKMIEICDPQSGLRFEDLWDCWKKHKQQDTNKLIKQYYDSTLVKLQDSTRSQIVDLSKLDIIC